MKCETEDHIDLQEKHHPGGNDSRRAEGESHESHGMLYSSENLHGLTFDSQEIKSHGTAVQNTRK